MLLLPVVARELLVQARRKNTYAVRVAASVIGGFLMLWILVVESGPIPGWSQGRALFLVLSSVAFGYCLFFGALATADCLSAEKREGTLGLVFLTDLKGYDVVLGKLASSSLHCVYGLMAVVPMLSMALLFGGVSGAEIARMALLLANTLFLSLSAGLLASTLSHDDRRGLFGAILLILIVALGPFELAYALTASDGLGTTSQLEEDLLTPSPVFAFRLTQTISGQPPLSAFYRSLGETQALAWAFLGLACAIVPYVSRDRPAGRQRARWRRWEQLLTLGNVTQRTLFRRRLLDQNPCFWLSSRHRHKPALVWILVAGLGGLDLWVCFRYHGVFYDSSVFLLGLLHVLLKVWFAVETCLRWAEDRQSQALELLLCTPLRTRDLMEGQGRALRRQFGWPVAVTAAFTLITWGLQQHEWGPSVQNTPGRHWFLLSTIVLLADLGAMRWVGAWQGLIARRPNRALLATLSCVLWLRWLVLGFLAGAAFFLEWAEIGRFQWLQSLSCWLTVALAFDLGCGWAARRNVLKYLRTIAANPSDYRPPRRLALITTEPQTFAEPSLDPLTAPQRRPRARLAPAGWVAILVLLLLAAAVGNHYWLESKVQRRILRTQADLATAKAQRARGRNPAPTTPPPGGGLDLILPTLVSDQQLPVAVQRNLPWRVRPLNDAEPFSPAMIQSMRAFVAANQSQLAQIHSVPSLHISDVRNAAGLYALGRLLECETLVLAEEGDTSHTLESLHRLFELGLASEQGPWSSSAWARFWCLDRGLDVLARVLSRSPLPGPELTWLQSKVSQAETGVDVEIMLREWSALVAAEYHNPLPTFGPPGVMLPPPVPVLVHRRVSNLVGAEARQAIAFFDAMDQLARIARRPWPECFIEGRRFAWEHRRISTMRYGGRMGLPMDADLAFNSLVLPAARMLARCRIALTSLAIERYRLTHEGTLPAKLNDLTPGVLPTVPRDPFDGKPIRFHPLPRGYEVSSVGPNGQENRKPLEAGLRRAASRVAADDLIFEVER